MTEQSIPASVQKDACAPPPSGTKTAELDVEMNQEIGFKHPVIDPKHQIRLIEIQSPTVDESIRCRFHSYDIHELAVGSDNAETLTERDSPAAPGRFQFSALSYTWGKATNCEDIHPVSISGCRFYVRSNLWHFLKLASRTMVGSRFFIDSMCIDQSNSYERQNQVQLMSDIYYGAFEVVVWLGLPDDDPVLHAGLSSLSKQSNWRRDWISTDGITEFDSETYALEWLGQCHYWTRTWIVQELILGSRIRVLCGEYDFAWAKIASLSPETFGFPHSVSLDGSTVTGQALLRGRATSIAVSPFLRMIEYKNKWDLRGSLPKNGVQKPVLPAYVALSAFSHQQCSIPHDKLYGILGLIEACFQHEIDPDYEADLEAIYTKALEVCIKSATWQLRNPWERESTYALIAARTHHTFDLEDDKIRHYRVNFWFNKKDKVIEDCFFAATVAFGCESCTQSGSAQHCPRHCEYISQLRPQFPIMSDSCKSNEALKKFDSDFSGLPPFKDTLLPRARTIDVDADERFAYSISYARVAGPTSEDLECLGLRLSDPFKATNCEPVTTYDAVYFTRKPENQSSSTQAHDYEFHRATLVRGPFGTYYAQANSHETESGDCDFLPALHESYCDECDKQITAVRFRCLDCPDYDLCYACFQNAPRSHPGHRLEAIRHPISANNWEEHPEEYLSTNFWRIAYHFESSLLDDLRRDPDEKSAFQGIFAGGMMFPWCPRKEVNPPYWACNLDCNKNPATDGVPHLRCMGLRLHISDPTDAPPKVIPPGYRFFGQNLLEAISNTRRELTEKFGEDVLLQPRKTFAKLSARVFDDNFNDSDQHITTYRQYISLSRILRPSPGKSEENVTRGGRVKALMLEVPIGHLSDEEAIFTIRAHDAVVVGHDGKFTKEETEEIEDREGEDEEEKLPAAMFGLFRPIHKSSHT